MTTKQSFFTNSTFVYSSLHYIIHLWKKKSINNILLIKTSDLRGKKANGGKTLMLGTSWALIAGICEVYFYIRAGWIAPKIISSWTWFLGTNHDNVLIHQYVLVSSTEYPVCISFHWWNGEGSFMFPSPNGIFRMNNVLLQLNLKPAQVNHEPLWRLFNYSIIIHYSGYKLKTFL